jgi:hypothetical protein
MLPTQRHIEGREHTAAVLNWWIRRCGFTHTMVTALAAWVCGDSTWLQGSQLSHLRNSRMRTPQFKLFEGVSGVNEAIATWKLQGKMACLKEWGPLPDQAPAEFLLDDAIYLWHPEKGEGHPLIFHDFCDLFAGRLRLPYVDDSSVSPGQSKLVSDRIGEELDRWLADRGGIRAGMGKLLEMYPVRDANRVSKLQQVIVGADSYSAAELDEELFALTELFGQLWGESLDGKSFYTKLMRAA